MSLSISFEFFPPKTEKGEHKLEQTVNNFKIFNPEYFSVTYGAGGSSQDKTLQTVLKLNNTLGVETAPHLSCISSSREQIATLLDAYKQQGIQRIVALRGDLPSGLGSHDGEFRHACDLVKFIRETHGHYFNIKVAAYTEFHPETQNANFGLECFRKKVLAGANSAITQYFYSSEAYFEFIESCQKIGADIPVIPGIMPISNYTQLARFSSLCGAEIPRWLSKRLECYADDLDSLCDYGTDVVSRLCETLIDGGAPGLHFYTLNKTEPTTAILRNLRLPIGKAQHAQEQVDKVEVK